MTLAKIIQLAADIKKGIEGRSEPHPLDSACVEKIDEVIRHLRDMRKHIDHIREGLDEV